MKTGKRTRWEKRGKTREDKPGEDVSEESVAVSYHRGLKGRLGLRVMLESLRSVGFSGRHLFRSGRGFLLELTDERAHYCWLMSLLIEALMGTFSH